MGLILDENEEASTAKGAARDCVKIDNLARACAWASSLFSRLDEKTYAAVCDEASESGAVLLRQNIMPDANARRMFEREVLLAGMPLSALPVESLYKPWSAGEGYGVYASEGLYLGDSARHMQALYAALAIEIPDEFAAMPDHLSLLLDLLALFLEAGNTQAALDLASDHFDWLALYEQALAERLERVVSVSAFGEDERQSLASGIVSMRDLVGALDAAIHAWAAQERDAAA